MRSAGMPRRGPARESAGLAARRRFASNFAGLHSFNPRIFQTPYATSLPPFPKTATECPSFDLACQLGHIGTHGKT